MFGMLTKAHADGNLCLQTVGAHSTTDVQQAPPTGTALGPAVHLAWRACWACCATWRRPAAALAALRSALRLLMPYRPPPPCARVCAPGMYALVLLPAGRAHQVCVASLALALWNLLAYDTLLVSSGV